MVTATEGIHAVTGAFGYSGSYIARRLLETGRKVITLTNSPDPAHALADHVPAFPLQFDRPVELRAALSGVDVLYNTYWVRFNHGWFTHREAIANTVELFAAAADAGVRRVVHVSIANPSLDSPLEYFRGKALLERELRESGMSYAILRPTVLFGGQDILINNIAWMLRRLPLFGVFGDGTYRLQPIHVDDLAMLAVQQGAERANVTIDAIGPETFTYRELVRAIGNAIGRQRPLVSVPPFIGYHVGRILGALVGDVIITREEIRGLLDGLLYVDSPPTGQTRLTEWAAEHRSVLGARYASELARRPRRRRHSW